MKSEVYSWRVSADLRTGLEREARRRKISVAAALELAAREWLAKSGAEGSDEEQTRLQEAASPYLGALAGGGARRAENARKTVRQRVLRRHGR